MPGGKTDSRLDVSASILSQMFSYLASLRIDTEGLLASLGLDPAAFKAPDARIPTEEYIRIGDAAARVSGDPCFGLHVGELAEPGSWSTIGYMMMSCRTLAEAFDKSAKYCRIIGGLIVTTPSFQRGKTKVVLTAPPDLPELSRHYYEGTLSSTVTMMRRLTGLAISPVEINLAWPILESAVEYARIFRCPVHSDQPETSMTLDPAIGSSPVVYANPALLDHIEGYAREFVAGLDEKDAVTRATTRLLLSRLADESLSIATIAREMAMSVRTLQTRLAAEGRCFADLLSDARKSLAMKYLRERFAVEEITCLLGFAEPSVFRKAFKKWTGMTPGAYRESALAARGLSRTETPVVPRPGVPRPTPAAPTRSGA
jgi:AraC-like DNA-binding protein